eukprot:6138855-Pyramimonas_sp.AAC.1
MVYAGIAVYTGAVAHISGVGMSCGVHRHSGCTQASWFTHHKPCGVHRRRDAHNCCSAQSRYDVRLCCGLCVPPHIFLFLPVLHSSFSSSSSSSSLCTDSCSELLLDDGVLRGSALGKKRGP